MQKYKVYFWKFLPKIFKEIKLKYKNNLKDYMNIYICDTLEEMYDLTDKIEKEPQERDYAGRTFCYNKNYYDIETGSFVKTSPCCGHIIINKKNLFMNVISHESTHAVIGYFSRKLKDCKDIFAEVDNEGNVLSECDINEELFCYMVGNIGDQIISKVE